MQDGEHGLTTMPLPGCNIIRGVHTPYDEGSSSVSGLAVTAGLVSRVWIGSGCRVPSDAPPDLSRRGVGVSVQYPSMRRITNVFPSRRTRV